MNDLDKQLKEEQQKLFDGIYDFDTVCTMCQCAPGTHAIYWPCPLLDNNPICGECCVIGCLKDTAALHFTNVTGKELTIQEMNEACQKCGKNYAKQNQELAKKMERDIQ